VKEFPELPAKRFYEPGKSGRDEHYYADSQIILFEILINFLFFYPVKDKNPGHAKLRYAHEIVGEREGNQHQSDREIV
jgi:hypothetical protein